MKMNCITYIESDSELKQLLALPALSIDFTEIIIGSTELSRYCKTTLEEMLDILNQAKKAGLSVVLEWDALNVEEKFREATKIIERLPLHDFKAIRVQDPGAVEFVKTHFPWLKIQLILENGNHNLIGLKEWSSYLGSQCERLVLSNELSREKLSAYARELSVPLEVLTFGRILLFYTPRKLLSPLEVNIALLSNKFIEAFGSSEESPHSGFPLIENRHGTFMFNVKDLYLLDHLYELEEMGISHARIDLRFDDLFNTEIESLLKLFKGEVPESELTLKKNSIRPMIKGFYNINKTDVLFTKLKNKRTQRQDQNYIGEIVDVERDVQLALMIKTTGLDRNALLSLKFITPEGKEKIVQLSWVKSSLGIEIETAEKNDLVLIPFTSGVSVKTQVYLNAKT